MREWAGRKSERVQQTCEWAGKRVIGCNKSVSASGCEAVERVRHVPGHCVVVVIEV